MVERLSSAQFGGNTRNIRGLILLLIVTGRVNVCEVKMKKGMILLALAAIGLSGCWWRARGPMSGEGREERGRDEHRRGDEGGHHEGEHDHDEGRREGHERDHG